MGIISATGRQSTGLSTYEDYIQTDAAINQGNSGGALIDTEGNLIGINTAIYSANQSQGIGFAIPWSTANRVMHDLIHHGKVLRGWLGIEVIEIKNSNDYPQLLITKIIKSSPAAIFGLQKDDIILAINDTKIINAQNALQRIGRMRPGKTVKITILRNGDRPQTINIIMGTKPDTN